MSEKLKEMIDKQATDLKLDDIQKERLISLYANNKCRVKKSMLQEFDKKVFTK